jgi:hypothetical protein
MRKPRTCFDEVLAVVQDEEQVLVAQRVGEGLGDGDSWLLAHPENLRDGLRDEGWVREGGQTHPAGSVLEVLYHLEGDRQGEPGLAASPWTGQRQQACIAAQQPFKLSYLAFTPDKAGELQRQVVG